MKKQFTEEQIIPILKDAEAGLPVKELCRKYSISDATFIRGVKSTVAWRFQKPAG